MTKPLTYHDNGHPDDCVPVTYAFSKTKYNKIVSEFGFMLRILWQYIGEESRGDDSYITCWSLHWKNNTVLPETENMAASHIPKNRVFNSFYVCSQDDMPQYRQYMRNKIAKYCSITSG